MDALKKLDVWKRACRLSADIYKLIGGCANFGFRDQLGRSALSIASNIAEGYGRESVKERIHFLRIAKASSYEAWTQILIGIESGLIDHKVGLEKSEEIIQISKMIYGLIAHIERSAGGKDQGRNPRP
ncbi:four helix bundle protein [bacterium endosymbiont of Escarpia laminata]|nr:MAG: four helix bundle protein [bacterium endosymbiont of Escarpia laminata]